MITIYNRTTKDVCDIVKANKILMNKRNSDIIQSSDREKPNTTFYYIQTPNDSSSFFNIGKQKKILTCFKIHKRHESTKVKFIVSTTNTIIIMMNDNKVSCFPLFIPGKSGI